MPLTLRLCSRNRELHGLPVAAWQAAGHAIECLDCLAQCGDCEAGPYVECDGEYLFADTLEELEARLAALSPAR